MTRRDFVARFAFVLALFCLLMTSRSSAAASNTVEQWNKIAEDAVVRSGAFQGEGFIYMGYVSAAVYDAVVAVQGGYEPYGPGVTAPAGASLDAAVIEAAYRTLVNYFPSQAALLDPLYVAALVAIPDGQGKTDGQSTGLAAANLVIALRDGDGRMTPVGATSSFPALPAGPGVWRLTPPAFAAPQTPWMRQMRPFILDTADQFLSDPPPSLSSYTWTEAFNEIQLYGAKTGSARTADQTATALFWTANAIRQYNRLVRDVIDAYSLTPLDSARLQAMVDIVAADASIAFMNGKYHFLFWRPVSAIDPTSVEVSPGDGFGPVPGYDDGNPATTEQAGWRPLVATPNHPEYPSAHGTLTSAIAEVLSEFLGTNRFNLLIRGFDPAGAAGNMDAVQVFSTPADLRNQIIDARVWAGLHYRFSTVAGVVLGRDVAKYDLRSAFQAIR